MYEPNRDPKRGAARYLIMEGPTWSNTKSEDTDTAVSLNIWHIEGEDDREGRKGGGGWY